MEDNLQDALGNNLLGDRYTEAERMNKNIENIYKRLRPIWLEECKDSVWLLKDEYIHTVAKILYLDDQMGGDLDPSSLQESEQNLLAWKPVTATIDKYKALTYSVVDNDMIKAILSSIIKNKSAKDSDRLKAIETYLSLYNGEEVDGVYFVNDIKDAINKNKNKNKQED